MTVLKFLTLKTQGRVPHTSCYHTNAERQLHVKVSHIWVQNCGIKSLVYTYIIIML